MKTSFNVILVLGLLSLVFFSCNEVSTQEQTQEQTQEYYILNDYVESGCLKDGTFIVNEDGVTVYRRASYKSGKLIDFFADMTYKFLDGSKSGKWKCPTQQAETQEEPTDIYQSQSEGITEQTTPEAQPQRQWVNCEYCHGSGIKNCNFCSGQGVKECRRCFGSGVINTGTIFSPETDGRGHTCPECAGRGTKRCEYCYGKGNDGNCISCDGRGQVRL